MQVPKSSVLAGRPLAASPFSKAYSLYAALSEVLHEALHKALKSTSVVKPRYWHRWRRGSLGLLLLLSCLLTPTIALGQLPTLTIPNGVQSLPSGVERRGILESTSIYLDGQALFRIASPAVLNRSELGSQIPVEVRAKQIEANLDRLVNSSDLIQQETLYPAGLEVVAETINGQPVLFARDDALAEAQVLLTVTNTDAEYAGTRKAQLALQWQAVLEQALRQAIALRQPEAIQRQVKAVVRTLSANLLLTLGLGAAWGLIGQRKQQLIERHAAEVALAQRQPPPAALRRGIFQGLPQYLNLQRRLQIVRFLQWLLFWVIAFAWVVAIAYSLSAFPQTRQFAKKFIAIPIALLISWFLTGLTNRIADFAIDRFIENREQEQSLTEANLQRIATIASVIKGLKMVLVYTIALLWLLQWLNLVPGSILTLGALLALVVSFAAQSLVRDLVNGFLILLEDQFRIGDFVRIGSTAGIVEISGLVENLNLRITQVRSTDGNLITLSNSAIAQVENMSRTWARTDFTIEVAYDTDIDRALALVRETVDQMAQEPAWQAIILDTQELFGIEQLSHSGIVIRIWIKTMPLKQWNTARELRRRLKIAFDRHQIQIGTPQQIWHRSASPPGPHEPSDTLTGEGKAPR